MPDENAAKAIAPHTAGRLGLTPIGSAWYPEGELRPLNVVVIPGDGIGPELTEAAIEVLRAAEKGGDFTLALAYHEAGAAHYRKSGRAMSDETLAACRAAAATLKGPVGDPAVRAPDGTEAGVLGGILRPALDAYANVRPIRLYPGVTSALGSRALGSIDYVIVRENTEGLYASRGRGFVTPDVAVDTMVLTRRGSERVARKAFEIARTRGGAPDDGTTRVTCVDKANVLRGFAFFREAFLRVAADHPDVQADCLYADAAAARLVQDPGHFDVLVMENFLGDILSDLGGATIGGLGMCPSGNIGDGASYFEPIHGSAPDLAGTDRANPLSMVLTAAMMLDWLGQGRAARRIREAVDGALGDGAIRIRPDGTVTDGTRAAGREVARRVH
jgi:3-isopropylmalate dehydrogenase